SSPPPAAARSCTVRREDRRTTWWRPSIPPRRPGARWLRCSARRCRAIGCCASRTWPRRTPACCAAGAWSCRRRWSGDRRSGDARSVVAALAPRGERVEVVAEQLPVAVGDAQELDAAAAHGVLGLVREVVVPDHASARLHGV